MEGLAQLINTYELVKARLNKGLYIEGILLTMFEETMHISKEVETEVRGRFSHKVFKTRIPRDTILSEAPSFGQPVMLYDITAKSSTAYMLLSKEVSVNAAKVR